MNPTYTDSLLLLEVILSLKLHHRIEQHAFILFTSVLTSNCFKSLRAQLTTESLRPAELDLAEENGYL